MNFLPIASRWFLDMSQSLLHIKNMVCPRCIAAVQSTLDNLNLPFSKVELGQVALKEPLSAQDKTRLSQKLQEQGFEILESEKSALISQIKTLVIEQIHHSSEELGVNFSTLLSEKLHHSYAYLSRLFSSVEGITIEKYITGQRIEKIKELLFYDELSLNEIAFRLNYSSTAYLSSQFKKETGMTPTEFKRNRKPDRNSIDAI